MICLLGKKVIFKKGVMKTRCGWVGDDSQSAAPVLEILASLNSNSPRQEDLLPILFWPFHNPQRPLGSQLSLQST